MLHQRPNTFAQTCLLASAFSLQSDGGPYIFVHLNWNTPEAQADYRFLDLINSDGLLERCEAFNEPKGRASADCIRRDSR